MLASILVGLDGSADSNPAFEVGLRWAKRSGARLVGMGILDEPGLHGSEEWLVGEAYTRRLNAELRQEMSEKLGRALDLAAKRGSDVGVSFEEVRRVGAPYAEILQEAQRCDVVLLGQHTHFRFGWDNLPDGTLERVLSDCSRPVVAVPERIKEGGVVMIAYDGSLQAARTLAAFQALGLGAEKEIHIVSIDADWKHAARCADRAVEFLASHGIESRPHPIPSHSPAESVLNWVFRLGAELLVMGAYGKPTMRDFFLGSTTRMMLRESPAPIFLYH